MITTSTILHFSLPTFSASIAYLAGVFVVYYVASAIYSIYFHPLAKFPGPRTSAISRLPLIRAHFRGKLHEYFCKIHAEYGPIVRTAPDELTIATSAGFRDVYQKRPSLPKDPYTRTPPPSGAETLFSAEADTHARIRRTFANAFSDKSLREQSAVIESYASRLILRLRNDIVKGGQGNVDLAKYYGYTTLDVMGELALGDSFQGLDGDGEHAWVQDFFLGVKFGSIRSSLSRFYPLDLIFGYVFLGLTSRIRQRNVKIGTDMITRRLGFGDLGPGKSDFISPVIGNVNEEQKKGITRAELNVNVIAMLLAGCQLTTVALAAATYFLLRYPETITALNQEIRTRFESENDIHVASMQELPYLEAVIMEALRMHHPTPSDPKPRVIASGGQRVDGYWIPGGTVIGVPAQATFHSPSNFVDPNTFHPERWLPKDHPRYDSRFAEDDKDAFQPFSIGPRNCIGQKVALAEARVILSRMVWAFDMELADKADWDWPDQRAYLVYEPKPLSVKLTERAF